jgi:DNA (cytosine-5)-methyltransferase 1
MNDYYIHNKLRVFTTFSGYDSQCLALNRLKQRYPGFDYELVGWAEIEKNAIKAHNLLFPEAKGLNYGDISKIDWSQVPDFDLLTYSSPCQSFSLAGDMSGGEEGSNTKSSLLWEIRKCIEAKRPKYMILENVYTLLSTHHIDVFKRWVDTLTAYGYESKWEILNAKRFGIPQNRDRVFLVSALDYSYFNGVKSIGLKKFEFAYGSDDIPKIQDILDKGPVDESYYMSREKIVKWIKENERRIREYISERNGIDIESIQTSQVIDEQHFINNDINMPRKKKLTEEEQELLAQQEIEEQITQEELAEFDSSFDVTPAEAEDKPVKPIIEYLTEEDKKRRGKDKCILRIPTPTCSDGSAPTIMATGYATADYKNFYSVGHFPKLAVFEVWHHEPDEEEQEAENALY